MKHTKNYLVKTVPQITDNINRVDDISSIDKE